MQVRRKKCIFYILWYLSEKNHVSYIIIGNAYSLLSQEMLSYFLFLISYCQKCICIFFLLWLFLAILYGNLSHCRIVHDCFPPWTWTNIYYMLYEQKKVITIILYIIKLYNYYIIYNNFPVRSHSTNKLSVFGKHVSFSMVWLCTL